MPSAIRQTAAAAVALIRTLQAGVADRRCHHLFVLGSTAEILRNAEALEARVVRLDPAIAAQASEHVRGAIASLGSIELHGDASSVATMSDGVGRLITERQLPILYSVQLMAAVMDGVEAGLRDLVLDREAPTKVKPVSRQVGSSERGRAPAVVDPRPTPAAPIPDAVLDLLGRATVAPAAASGTPSGQLTIKKDTERI